jgi:teichoic acid transport system ATP-binding protein
MIARLGFAIAINSDKDIVLIDEIMSAGDATFRQKADAEMDRIIGERTVMIVSHDMNTIKRFASKVIWLNKGLLAAMGEPEEVIERYLAASRVKKPSPHEEY